MTAEQYRLQNKDLRTRLENHKVARQISEDGLRARIAELESGLRGRDSQILMLQAYIAKMEREHSRVSEEKAALKEENGRLGRELEKRDETIALLVARLNKDSSNSSKPPSADGFKKIVRNNRDVSCRKPGGQPGHKGSRLEFSDELKELVSSGAVPVEVVGHGAPNPVFAVRYELDIQVGVSVKEHRFYPGAAIPAELNNAVNYGVSLKAMCVYMTNVGLMSAERVAVFIGALTGGSIRPAKATVLAFQREMSAKLGGEIEAVRESLLAAPVLNIDETPIKSTQRPSDDGETMEESKGTTFNLCLRTYSSPDATLLVVSAHKSSESIADDGILPVYPGTLVHDHDIKLYFYSLARHGECNAHIGRYLKGLLDLAKHQWLTLMASLLLDMLQRKHEDLAGGIGSMDMDSLNGFSAGYDQIIGLGKTENAALNPESQIAKDELNLLLRLEKYKENHLLFAYDYAVPYSNNQAERDLRWAKTQQKVSGCHRSFGGAVHMARVMSFILTLKKRKRDVFPAIVDILLKKPVLV
jgi:hypothetical protein